MVGFDWTSPFYIAFRSMYGFNREWSEPVLVNYGLPPVGRSAKQTEKKQSELFAAIKDATTSLDDDEGDNESRDEEEDDESPPYDAR